LVAYSEFSANPF